MGDIPAEIQYSHFVVVVVVVIIIGRTILFEPYPSQKVLPGVSIPRNSTIWFLLF
jgi:hypothetical protein